MAAPDQQTQAQMQLITFAVLRDRIGLNMDVRPSLGHESALTISIACYDHVQSEEIPVFTLENDPKGPSHRLAVEMARVADDAITTGVGKLVIADMLPDDELHALVQLAEAMEGIAAGGVEPGAIPVVPFAAEAMTAVRRVVGIIAAARIPTQSGSPAAADTASVEARPDAQVIPFTTAGEFIERGRAEGQDALGVANDAEAPLPLNNLTGCLVCGGAGCAECTDE